MAEQMLCTFGREIKEQFMAQYNIKGTGVLDGIVKFIIYTKI